MSDKTYIPVKYRQLTKAKKKFNVVSHLESLSTQFLLDEVNSVTQQNKLLYPNWTIYFDSIKFLEYRNVFSELPECNVSFKLQSDNSNEYSNTAISLSRFEAWTHFDKKGSPLGIKWNPSDNTDQFIVDIILNAGGPIWALDWCPMKLTRSQQIKENQDCFIAIGANRSLNELHAIGESYEGTNIIQIWNLGPLTTKGIPQDNKPFMSLGIVHNKSCVWSLSWCPTGSPLRTECDDNEIPRLGLLAATFGDGTLSVYAVPNPNYLYKKKGIPKNSKPLLVELNPVFSTKLKNNMIHSVKWSNKDDYELLATGCSNGYIAIWKLTDLPETVIKSTVPISYDYDNKMDTENEDDGNLCDVNLSHIPVLYRKAHSGLVKSINWSPLDPHILATCSLSSSIKLWDIRYYSSPISVVPSQGGIVNTISWDKNNNMIVAGLDNGGIRLFTPDGTKKFEYHQDSFVWYIDTSPYMRFMASCDSEGRVIVYPLISDFNDSKNNRRVKSLEGCIEKCEIIKEGNSELFTLASSNEASIEENTSKLEVKTPQKKSKDVNQEPIHFPDNRLSWNIVKWSPNISHPNWIAYGGNYGIVRIQLLRWIEPTMK